MLGQRPAGEDVSAQYGVSPAAFFNHHPALQPFLQGALERAAADLRDSRLSLHPSLYPVLTLLAKLQPGDQEQTRYDYWNRCPFIHDHSTQILNPYIYIYIFLQ